MRFWSGSGPLLLAACALSALSCRTAGSNKDAEVLAKDNTLHNENAGNFYDIEHVVQIEITSDDWDNLRWQQPKGGRCNFAFTGANYDWFKAKEMKVDGVTLKNVGLKKRSFCNSLSSDKPSMAVSFDKYEDGQKDAAISAFGTANLTLNNSLQDQSYVRQCLAYDMFNKAGVHATRCNFAHVKVNGKDLGIYVNLEPLKKAFFKRTYGEPLGKLYEISGTQFESWAYQRFQASQDSFNGDTSINDIKALTEAIVNDNSSDLNKIAEIVDLKQVMNYWAMELILIHWDGFARGINNSNIYFGGDGKMRMVPWGTDQIFTAYGKGEDTEFYHNENLINKIYNTPQLYYWLVGTVKWFLDNQFNENEIYAKIDHMAKIVAPYVDNYGQNESKWSMDSLKNNIAQRRSKLASFMNLGATSGSGSGNSNGGSSGGGGGGDIHKDKICSDASSDWDHDGWGWENNQSCKVPDGGIPKCRDGASDGDHDGWGWEDGRSCQVR